MEPRSDFEQGEIGIIEKQMRRILGSCSISVRFSKLIGRRSAKETDGTDTGGDSIWTQRHGTTVKAVDRDTYQPGCIGSVDRTSYPRYNGIQEGRSCQPPASADRRRRKEVII